MNKYLQKLFAICNSGAYPERKEYFYPVKTKLLKKHGIADGYDLQVIQQPCWTCDGTGFDEWHDGEQCEDCDGTGIYRTDKIVLARYKLGGRLYHSPVDIAVEKVAPKHTFDNYIRHEQPNYGEFLKALKIILLVYDFPSFYTLMYKINQARKDGESSYWRHFTIRNSLDRWFYTLAILISGAMPLWDSESVEVTFKNFDKYSLFSWVLRPYKNYMYQHYLLVRVNRFKWLVRICLMFTGWRLIKYNNQGLWCRHSSLKDCGYYEEGYPAFLHLEWILKAYKKGG